MSKDKKFSIKADGVEIFPEFMDENNKSLWNIKWVSYTRGESPVKIGNVSFAGEPVRGRLSLIVEPEEGIIDDSREMKTTLRAIVEWAFNQKGIYEIEADALHEDDHRIYLLQAAGLVFRNGTRTLEHYSITKQSTSWTGLYLFIGIIAGFAIGVVLDSMVMGLVIGVFAGFAIGAAMDQKETMKMMETTGEKSLSRRRQLFFKKNKKNEAAKEKEEEQEFFTAEPAGENVAETSDASPDSE